MAGRTAVRALLLCAIAFALALCVAAVPATTEADLSRVVAIGDVHGDFAALIEALRIAGLVNATEPTFPWVGGSDTLVQMGDLLDRGPDDARLLDYMDFLRADAAAKGGRVVTLMGNHELLNLQHAFHYVHPESDKAFDGDRKLRKASFSLPEGKYAKQLLANYPALHIEDTTLFVHAGLIPAFATHGVDAVNAAVRRAIEANDERATVLGVHGPVWTRTVVREAIAGKCDLVDRSLEILGVERMIVGHTPERQGNFGEYCRAKLIVVDIGMSRWMYGNEPAALELLYNKATKETELAELTKGTEEEARLAEEENQRLLREGKAAGSDNKDNKDDKDNKDTDDEAAKKTLEQMMNEDPQMMQQMYDTLREANTARPGEEDKQETLLLHREQQRKENAETIVRGDL